MKNMGSTRTWNGRKMIKGEKEHTTPYIPCEVNNNEKLCEKTRSKLSACFAMMIDTHHPRGLGNIISPTCFVASSHISKSIDGDVPCCDGFVYHAYGLFKMNSIVLHAWRSEIAL